MFTPFIFLSQAPSIMTMILTRLLSLAYKTDHTLSSLSYPINMLYNSIIMALTASQVLAQNPYNSNVLSSYMSIIAGSTAEPSPTVAPYVTTGSDGQATTINPNESGNASAQTDPSTTALPNDSVNYDSPASSPATGDYTTDYTSAASEGSSQSGPSSSSSSFPPAPSASLSNPPIYLHIKLEKDPTKCLAIFDTSHQFNTPVM